MGLEEKRLTTLETNVDVLNGLSKQLFEMLADNKLMMADNKLMLAHMDARQTAHEAFLAHMDARQAAHEAFVWDMNERQAEARRDIQQMHRLWVRIARQYGWTDLFSDEEDNQQSES